MPEDIIHFIVESKFFAFSYDFMHIETDTHLNVVSDWFDVEQNHSELYKIGLKSGSTFANIFSLLTTLLTIA